MSNKAFKPHGFNFQCTSQQRTCELHISHHPKEAEKTFIRLCASFRKFLEIPLPSSSSAIYTVDWHVTILVCEIQLFADDVVKSTMAYTSFHAEQRANLVTIWPHKSEMWNTNHWFCIITLKMSSFLVVKKTFTCLNNPVSIGLAVN